MTMPAQNRPKMAYSGCILGRFCLETRREFVLGAPSAPAGGKNIYKVQFGVQNTPVIVFLTYLQNRLEVGVMYYIKWRGRLRRPKNTDLGHFVPRLASPSGANRPKGRGA